MESLQTAHPTCPRCQAAFATLLLMLAGCSGGLALRSSPPAVSSPPADGTDPTAAECEQIRSEIRGNQEYQREAPTTSTSSVIVAASEGKADKRIDDLRARADELDCPAEDSATKLRPQAPLQPAPGGGSTPP